MLAQQTINGIAIGGIYALIAVGFSLIYSILRFTNLAHGSLLAVGAYAGLLGAGLLRLGLAGSIAVAGAATAIVAALAEKGAFRPIRLREIPIVYFLISSMAVSLLFENLLLVGAGATFYVYPRLVTSTPLIQWPVTVGYLDFLMMLTACLALVALNFIIYGTKIGRAMRAASYDLRVAALMGVDTDRIVTFAFLMAGCLAGIAGVFLGIKYSVYPQLGQLILKGFVAAIFGGLGSVAGAVVGGVVLGLIEIMLVAYVSSAFSPVFIYALLIFILLVRPSGLLGRFTQEKA
ncbi:MAG: branched-chain amino acid ABC transporter permease [Firmicutes bacterium]|nr:branched-chain amino acid ABC transporter permease [Bacillota bacterium]